MLSFPHLVRHSSSSDGGKRESKIEYFWIPNQVGNDGKHSNPTRLRSREKIKIIALAGQRSYENAHNS